tara:strand:+ start:1139 stop:1405 length:267 start_codon:yes stop_codon:yes gene_type:complete
MTNDSQIDQVIEELMEINTAVEVIGFDMDREFNRKKRDRARMHQIEQSLNRIEMDMSFIGHLTLLKEVVSELNRMNEILTVIMMRSEK